MAHHKKAIPLDDWIKARDENIAARFNQPEKLGSKPLTERHKRYQQVIRDKAITVAMGPAGTGKSGLACEVGVELFRQGKVKSLQFFRPLIPCGPELGFLPGDIHEKVAPYSAPMTAFLRKLLGDDLDTLLMKGVVQINALATLRGATFDNAFVVLDEAQNAQFSELHMFLTRYGKGSKLVVNGDIRQSDLGVRKARCPFYQVASVIHKDPEVGFVLFRDEDVLRPDIVNRIDNALYDYLDEKNGK